MASLDSLPADQRAVLQLILQRDRTYDDIAAMLSIERSAVRQRALDALNALGPSTGIPADQRALIADYLLGQLPQRIAERVHEHLAVTPTERAWARVLAGELAPLSNGPLPEIPSARPQARATDPAGPDWDLEAEADEARMQGSEAPGVAPRAAGPPSSRRGGAILLGGFAAVIVAAIVVVILITGGSRPSLAARHDGSLTSRSHTSGAGVTSGGSTTASATTKPKVLAQLTLHCRSRCDGHKTLGIVQVVAEGSAVGIVLIADHMPPNTRSNAYAVWLASSRKSRLVGFVGARVGKRGVLETEGVLPSDASRYHSLLVTLESSEHPVKPGKVILSGPFSETPVK
jgi:hypothetical protein